jgi:FkbM family methyltransferase
MQQTDTESFGSHSLPSPLDGLARFCQRIPTNWIGKRVSFVLRKPVLWRGQEVIDISVKGINFRLYPKTNLSDKRLICTPDLLDGRERKFLEKSLPSDAVVIDIGANIGGYSLLLADKIPNARFICIEPDPELFHNLKYNISLNDTPDRLIPENAAITETDGEVTLYLIDSNRGQNSLLPPSEKETHDTIEVTGVTLLNILRKHNIPHPHLLKLDIEGYEPPVLRAFFNEAPESYWPDFIQLEQQKKAAYNEAVSLVMEKGYTLQLETRMNLLLSK